MSQALLQAKRGSFFFAGPLFPLASFAFGRVLFFLLRRPTLGPSLRRRIAQASSLDQHGVAAGPRRRGSLRACSLSFSVVEITL